uniref:ER membrane protein complex subunit 4 n=1 Tax=Globodera pallida TaxID=36090 RepID=A0A183BKM0_GLOPA
MLRSAAADQSLNPPGYNPGLATTQQNDSANRAEQQQQHLLSKRAWDMALQPIKSLPMNMFMMYMAGNTISIFPIMMVVMMAWRPMKTLMSVNAAFKPLEQEHVGSLIIHKIVFVLGNLNFTFIAHDHMPPHQIIRSLFSILLFFASFCSVVFFGCDASPDVQSAPVDARAITGNRINCYVCNSKTKGEADCAESNFDKLKPFIKKCDPVAFGPYASKEAMACRKVEQTVEDETTIVRECAYTGEKEVDGKRRTGNKAVTVLIYQCTNDQKGESPCNSALSSLIGTSSSILSTLSLVLFALFLSFY